MKPRVAVIGGDGRTERVKWPKGLRIDFYASETRGAIPHTRQSLRGDRYDHVVVLSRWSNRDLVRAVKDVVPFSKIIFWDRGVPEAAKEMEKYSVADDAPEEEKPVTILSPEVKVITQAPMTFASALDAEIARAAMSQGQIATLVNTSQEMVSHWVNGRTGPRPRVYGHLLALFPDLKNAPRPRFPNGTPDDDFFIEQEIEAGERGEIQGRQTRQEKADALIPPPLPAPPPPIVSSRVRVPINPTILPPLESRSSGPVDSRSWSERMREALLTPPETKKEESYDVPLSIAARDYARLSAKMKRLEAEITEMNAKLGLLVRESMDTKKDREKALAVLSNWEEKSA